MEAAAPVSHCAAHLSRRARHHHACRAVCLHPCAALMMLLSSTMRVVVMPIPALLLPLQLCPSTELFCGGPTLTAPKLAVPGGVGAPSGAMSQRVAPTCIGYASHLDCPYAACQLVICRFGLAAGSCACALGDCHPCVICHACMAICVSAQPEAPQGCMWWVRGHVLPRSHSEMLRRSWMSGKPCVAWHP